MLSREGGSLCSCGSSQASALTATTTLGGKASWPTAARTRLQSGKALLEEALAPLAHDLPGRIEPKGNLVVSQPLCGVECNLGSEDVAIRCRIRRGGRLAP